MMLFFFNVSKSSSVSRTIKPPSLPSFRSGQPLDLSARLAGLSNSPRHFTLHSIPLYYTYSSPYQPRQEEDDDDDVRPPYFSVQIKFIDWLRLGVEGF